jgi:hypothetical protein
MKTPQEKAKELFRKVYFLDSKIWQDTAKQIALIMVEEMINEFDSLEHYRIDYWYEVKEEIQKL